VPVLPGLRESRLTHWPTDASPAGTLIIMEKIMNVDDIIEITADTTVSWLKQPDATWRLVIWEATGRYSVETTNGRKRSLSLRELALDGVAFPMAFDRGAANIDGLKAA
jgi:hypothetical protein